MKLRSNSVRIIIAAAIGFALAVVAVAFILDRIVRSDVREEMASTLESVSYAFDNNFYFVLRHFAALAVREIDDPANVTEKRLEQMRVDYDLDLLRLVRKSGAVVAQVGNGDGLLKAEVDFADADYRIEMGVDLFRFSRGEIGAILMGEFCKNWPNTSDGFPICIREQTGLVVSSGFQHAATNEYVAQVFEDPEAFRNIKEGSFFRTRIYGMICGCVLVRKFGYAFVVAVPLRAISKYRALPLLAVSLVLLVLVVAFTLVALRRSELLRRLQYYIDGEKTRMKEDLSAACLVQTSALPPPFPPQPAFSVRARMDPAKVVGGDFYDYQMLPNGCFYFLVADVSGKGISAAMFMMRAKSVIKHCLAETRNLETGMAMANDMLSAHNESMLFVTVWIGVLEPRTGMVYYVNAGHNPPIVKRADGKKDIEWVNCPPSLVMAMMSGVKYPVHELALQPGDSLVLYTDGVTEAQNEYGKLYGEKRLEKVLRECEGPVDVALRKDLDAFQGKAEPADDVTILTIDYKGTPPGAPRGFPCSRQSGFAESVQFVEAEMDRLVCPQEIRTQFLIAYDEIGSNVVNYSGAPFFTVKVAFEATPPAFTLTVTDAGKPFNPLDKAAPDLNQSLEQRAFGGFGIFITRKLMDDVIYSRDGDLNVLTLRKKLPEV